MAGTLSASTLTILLLIILKTQLILEQPSRVLCAIEGSIPISVPPQAQFPPQINSRKLKVLFGAFKQEDMKEACLKGLGQDSRRREEPMLAPALPATCKATSLDNVHMSRGTRSEMSKSSPQEREKMQTPSRTTLKTEIEKNLHSSKPWTNIKRFENHPLLGNAAKRIPDIARSSKSKNTRAKYDSYFERFASWCKSHKFKYLPAEDTTINLFLSGLISKGVGHSVIDGYYYSIKWNHQLMLLTCNPCDSNLVKLVYEGSRKTVCEPVNKKQPVTADIISKIVDKFGGDNDNLKDLRLCTMCILGFSGFFRYSELSRLKMKNINFQDDYISVNITESKTDQCKSGSEILIAKTQTKLCPVSWLLKYIAVAGLTFASDEFIFTKVRYIKKTDKYVLADTSTPLSYSRAREIFLSALENIGEGKSSFGLHSLRSGGASAVANSGDVVDVRLLNKHGRWKSSSSSGGYIHYNIQNRLQVSKHLGI
ncbi:uncharacterized protein LOC128558980 [Mercenaria mercenaria]|uniref:uncharacterized protein LOC128558980 n=1 Tax=Mercenaria mercenaria TaxID=6596 RepID=UPI00234EDFF2|nr:uncharacterized protein LOC128558980 [Mercenaria mercenaria]